MSSSPLRRAAAALALAAALAFGACSVQPPALVDPHGPADFDPAAALTTLRELAAAPHPIGSPEHARVQALVVARLTALGLAPQVQKAVGMNGHATTAGLVQNVVARLDPPSAAAAKPILLVCHYDSRMAAAGAGDDGAAVAALLEVMRALKAGPPLARPVIFLATDGEEQGLLGAEAFVSQHPWAKDVAVVLNFEARGTRGPALLFETSISSGRLVRAAAQVVPHLTGTSLAGAVYRTMPNDTDLSVFLEEGYDGLNFAFNQGWAFYHTRQDDAAHLDPRSLAHHGRTALALARKLGSQGVPAPAPDPVYFNLLPGVFVVYGVSLAWALAAYLALACALALSGYRGRFGALVRALVAAAIGVALAVAFGAAVAQVAAWLHGTVLGAGDGLRSRWYHAGIVTGAAGLTLGALALLGPAEPAAHALAALGAWTALAVATAVKFPPASYLFAWPPLLCLLMLQRAARGAPAPETAWRDFVLRAVVPAPAAVLLASTDVLFFESLGNDLAGSAVTGLLTALATSLAVPVLELPAGRRCAGIVLAGALACLGAGAGLTRPSRAHPDQVWLAYGLDANAREARWLSAPAKPGPWLAARLSADPEIAPCPDLLVTRAQAPVAQAKAPLADVPAPEVTVAADEPAAGGRRVKLRFSSGRGATLFWVALPAPRLKKIKLDGRVLPPPGIHHWGDTLGRHNRRRGDPKVDWTLECCGVGPAGFELELELDGPGPLPVRVCDVSVGLPPAVAGAPPPDTLVPYDFGLCTVVARSVSR